MASLTVRSPEGKVRTVPLHKRITSIGRSADNDVQLEDPAVPDSASGPSAAANRSSARPSITTVASGA